MFGPPNPSTHLGAFCHLSDQTSSVACGKRPRRPTGGISSLEDSRWFADGHERVQIPERPGPSHVRKRAVRDDQ